MVYKLKQSSMSSSPAGRGEADMVDKTKAILNVGFTCLIGWSVDGLGPDASIVDETIVVPDKTTILF